MYTFEELYKIIDRHDTRAVCFPYETAGVFFDDYRDRMENRLKDDSGFQGAILQGRLAQIAGVRSDNKTVYKIIPSIGPSIFVEFWDGRTTVSDKMFIRDKKSLVSCLKYDMMGRIEKMEADMGLDRNDTLRILSDLSLWAVKTMM
ncbi:MAG: hypothetical protein K5656_03280 [Lachnospiraceae bacterium]|nr:hypothetical protein [Lachnospiraceae bacterium]